MKKKRKLGRKLISFLLTLAMVVVLMPGTSFVVKASDSIEIYTPIDVTGFNVKTIANSDGRDDSLTGIDNNDTHFVAKSFAESANKDTQYAFPDGTFSTNSGKQFTVKSYSENNTLQIREGSTQGRLDFPSAGKKYSKLAILTTGGDGTANFTVTVNYTDNTSTTVNANAPDWVTGASNLKVYSDLYQISYDNNGIRHNTKPGLYETVITVDFTKVVSSLSFTWTGGGRANIFGVSGVLGGYTWGTHDDLPTNGAYYKLTDDIIINTSWNVPTGTTLDLNGHKIEISTDGVLNVENGHDLTIEDSSFGKKGYIKGTIQNSGTINNLFGVTYDGNGSISGVAPTDSNHYPGGATVSVLANTGNLKKIDSTFAGWKIGDDATVYANSEDNITGATVSFTISTDTTLSAKWNTNAVPATVNANNQTYDGTAKELVIITGETTGGTMYYAIGDSETVAPEFDGTSENENRKWKTSIPKATNAGTYYVWYKVDPATNYNGVAPACIVVKIKKNETSTTTPTETTEKVESVTVYRLYYGPTMEHFYTTSAYERKVLIDKYGWVDEGIAWKSPKAPTTDTEKKTIKPVYRLFNPFTTDHHYTKDANERKTLIDKYGWKDEGVAFYSNDKGDATVYRLWHPGLITGAHHFTTGKHEYDVLITRGWIGETEAFKVNAAS